MIFKNNNKPISCPPRPPGAEDRKYGGLLLFLNIVKIENSDFITILAHANLNSMINTINYCSKSTDNVLGGSLTHIESP